MTWWPLKIVYQLPAPSIVTLSTMMWRFTWYVPGGTYTLRWDFCAKAMALSIGVGRVVAAGRVGAEQQHVRGDEVDLRRRDQLASPSGR